MCQLMPNNLIGAINRRVLLDYLEPQASSLEQLELHVYRVFFPVFFLVLPLCRQDSLSWSVRGSLR